jgi:MHS family proline/betaine transporter-like MFS transporter
MIAAASIGNALEWFDLLTYGYFAVTISKVFFPAADPTASLLLALGTFGASYLVRPLGAIVLGAYGDHAGRKASMLASVALMMLGTILMAAMPGYASVGLVAPIGILLARLLQGFAIGGEFGSATAFLVEQTANRKGFFASWQWSGQGLAAVLASAFGVLLTTTLSPAQLEAWGWRIPFAFGLLVGPVGLYIRQHLDETPEFLATEKTKTPVGDILRRQLDRLFLAIGLVIASTSANYLILYMPTYGIKQLGLPQSTGFVATLIGGVLLTVGAPFVGHLSDTLGRTRIMAGVAILFAISAYPAFVLLTASPSLLTIILVVGWLSLLKAAYSGILPALMAEMFPVQTRSTGMSLSYNIAVPIFGGFAPFIVTWLINVTGDSRAPAYYLAVTALLSLVVVIVIRRRLRLV